MKYVNKYELLKNAIHFGPSLVVVVVVVITTMIFAAEALSLI
jgi:hypothetical protein